MKIQPLSPSEQGTLMRQLSDLESGSARQWYWLEIAQKYPASEHTKKTKTLGSVHSGISSGRGYEFGPWQETIGPGFLRRFGF